MKRTIDVINGTALISLLLTLTFSACKKEDELITVVLDSTVIYQDINNMRMDWGNAAYLMTAQNFDSLYKISDNKEISKVNFFIGNDTVNNYSSFHGFVNLNENFFLVSGYMVIVNKGIETKIVQTGSKIDTIKSNVSEKLQMPQSYVVRKSDGKVFFFPEEFKNISFDYNSAYTGIHDFSTGIAQSDNNNNVYVYSYSKGNLVVKITLPVIDVKVVVSEFITETEWHQYLRFLVDKKGNGIYIDNIDTFPHYVSNSGVKTSLKTFSNRSDLNIGLFYPISWLDNEGEIHTIAITNDSKNIIVKIVPPNSFAFEKTLSGINTDMGWWNIGYNAIVNNKNNSIIFPGICYAMEAVLPNYDFINYNFFGHVGYQMNPSYYLSKDYYLYFYENSIYSYPINLNEYKSKFPGLLFNTDGLESKFPYDLTMDYINNKMILCGTKKNSGQNIIVIIDLANPEKVSEISTGKIRPRQVFNIK